MSTTEPPGYWDNGTWIPVQPVYVSSSPEPKYTTPQDYYQPTSPNYQPELKRIADALERLASRPAIGFSVPCRCIVCERMGMQDGFTLGYGSANDGEWVCDDCIHRLVDTEVVRLDET